MLCKNTSASALHSSFLTLRCWVSCVPELEVGAVRVQGLEVVSSVGVERLASGEAEQRERHAVALLE